MATSGLMRLGMDAGMSRRIPPQLPRRLRAHAERGLLRAVGGRVRAADPMLGRRRFARTRATPPKLEGDGQGAASSTGTGDSALEAEAAEGGPLGPYTDVIVRVGAAIAFGAFIDLRFGFEKAEAYFTGYILEQTLSVDNLFVFILLFSYFKVPSEGKDRVLGFGIFSAAVLRGILIVLGAEIIEQFEPVLLVFALILLYSAYGVLFPGKEEEEDFEDNGIVKLCRRFITVSDTYEGDKFFTRTAAGALQATPLLLVLAVVELSDLLFAVDSIPAVFGVTKDPLIVYSSNMFAILGLRSLFKVVSSAMEKLTYLDKSVGIVLGFVGLKMFADFGGYHIPNEQSLLVVCGIVGGGVALSILNPPEE